MDINTDQSAAHGHGGVVVGLSPQGRRAYGHAYRPARAQHRGPSRHRAGSESSRRILEGEEQLIDTGTAADKCFLDMLGVFAELETNPRKERQLEGIASAKARGVYKGRKASIDPAKVDDSRGHRAVRDRESAQDRPRVGLSRAD